MIMKIVCIVCLLTTFGCSTLYLKSTKDIEFASINTTYDSIEYTKKDGKVTIKINGKIVQPKKEEEKPETKPVVK